MRFAYGNKFRLRRTRLVVALLLSVFCIASLGIPVVRRPLKDLSEPFPCQNSPCGCASAEQCWRNCCCHTNREKVVWARRNGIAPPDYVVAAAEKESDRAATPSCCTHCKHHHAAACSTPVSSRAEHQVRDSKHRRSQIAIGFINFEAARRCKGLPGFLTIEIPLMLPDPPLVWSLDLRPVGKFCDQPPLLSSAELSPPIPPPRLL